VTVIVWFEAARTRIITVMKVTAWVPVVASSGPSLMPRRMDDPLTVYGPEMWGRRPPRTKLVVVDRVDYGVKVSRVDAVRSVGFMSAAARALAVVAAVGKSPRRRRTPSCRKWSLGKLSFGFN